MKIALKMIDTYLDEQHRLLELINKNIFHFETDELYNLATQQIKRLESWKINKNEPVYHEHIDIIINYQKPTLDISLEELITFVSNLSLQERLLREKTNMPTLKQVVLPSLENQLQILQKIDTGMNGNTYDKKTLQDLFEITLITITEHQKILVSAIKCVSKRIEQQKLLKILVNQEATENTPTNLRNNDLNNKRKNSTVTFFPEPPNNSKKTKQDDNFDEFFKTEFFKTALEAVHEEDKFKDFFGTEPIDNNSAPDCNSKPN